MLEAAVFSLIATITVCVCAKPSLNTVTCTPVTGSAVASILLQPGRMKRANCPSAQSLLRTTYVPELSNEIKPCAVVVSTWSVAPHQKRNALDSGTVNCLCTSVATRMDSVIESELEEILLNSVAQSCLPHFLDSGK